MNTEILDDLEELEKKSINNTQSFQTPPLSKRIQASF